MNPKTIWSFYKDYIQGRAHISHKSLNVIGKKRQHPLSVNTSLGCKNKHVITNPYQTLEGFLKSLHVISFFYKKSLPILIVNTNPSFAFLIENFFHKTDLNNSTVYYCNEKWVGGLLTNWKQASSRVKTYVKFSERFENFILQNHINFPSYKKMALSFQGLKPRNRSKQIQRPSLVFIVNPNENRHVVEESMRLHIPVMAITDSNTPLLGISFPIPGNSNSVHFVHYCLQWIARIITGCKKQQTKKSQPSTV